MADACVFLIQNYNAKDIGEFINVGTGTDIQIKYLADLIKEVVIYKGKIIWDTSKPDGMPKKLLNISKIKALGWKPQTCLENGIRKVYTWYVKSLNNKSHTNKTHCCS